jgi:ribosomal protein S18 acetylase RimI-like enzyme
MPSVLGGIVRPAIAADAAAIATVEVTSWRETYGGIFPGHVIAGYSVEKRMSTWSQILHDPAAFPSYAVFVAEHESTIVGFGSGCMQRSERLSGEGYDGEVASIYMLRAFQRRGFGLALMGAMARDLAARQLHAASLWVLKENAGARRFYEKIGGELIGEREEIRSYGIRVELAYGWRNLAKLLIF